MFQTAAGGDTHAPRQRMVGARWLTKRYPYSFYRNSSNCKLLIGFLVIVIWLHAYAHA